MTNEILIILEWFTATGSGAYSVWQSWKPPAPDDPAPGPAPLLRKGLSVQTYLPAEGTCGAIIEELLNTGLTPSAMQQHSNANGNLPRVLHSARERQERSHTSHQPHLILTHPSGGRL